MAKKKKSKASRESTAFSAAQIAELLEEQKVTNLLITNLHKDLLQTRAELKSEIVELKSEVAELSGRFDVHRGESYRRHADHEGRLSSLETRR